MPYYGDYYAGDPGLFGKIGKAFRRVGRAVGSVALPVVKTAFPGVAGVLTAAQRVRAGLAGTGPAVSGKGTLMGAFPGSMPLAQAPGVMPLASSSTRTTRRAAKRRRTARRAPPGTTFTRGGRARSAFLSRRRRAR